MREDRIGGSLQQEVMKRHARSDRPMDADYSFPEETTYDLRVQSCSTFRDRVVKEKREWEEPKSAE
jgi:hypothetical protein